MRVLDGSGTLKAKRARYMAYGNARTTDDTMKDAVAAWASAESRGRQSGAAGDVRWTIAAREEARRG